MTKKLSCHEGEDGCGHKKDETFNIWWGVVRPALMDREQTHHLEGGGQGQHDDFDSLSRGMGSRH